MSGSAKKPEIVVFAGPNGSGKSTITDLLRPINMIYINADEIQRVMGCDNLEAATIAENRREGCVKAHQSFCFETVLSRDHNLNLLKRARQDGFFYPVLLYSDSRSSDQCCPGCIQSVGRWS